MRNVADAYPLSPTQQGMLFESLYANRGTGLYVEQITWDMLGDLNKADYRRAWETAVQRHPVLRTALLWESLERPLQVVREHVQIPWQDLDWRGDSQHTQQSKFLALLDSDRGRSFDLAAAPLLRFTLVQVADDAFRFLWTFHHVILDGWSEPLVLREVLAIYEAYSRSDNAPAMASPPYRDYIAWLGRQDRAGAETFWRNRFEGFDKATPLPLDSPNRSTDDSFGEVERTWSLEATHRLQQFLRTEQLTLSTLVQGAWAFVLSMYSGERDVVFGNVVAGRPSDPPHADRIIGLLANTLPVRVTINPAQSVADWLRALQTGESMARAHEHVALADVIGCSAVSRGTPLFESLLAVENLQSSMPPLRDSQLDIREMKRLSSRASYPLVIGVVPGQVLSVGIGFKRSRFGDAAIDRIFAQLDFALEAFISNRSSRLDELLLLTPGEYQTVVVDWNAKTPGGPFSTDQGVHVLFDKQAERTPDNTAIVDGETQISYAQLRAQSHRIARWLVCQGVNRGQTVGLLMQRSPELLAAILGVLRTGAAYVPLDPANPAPRNALILADANVCLLLSDRDLRNKAPEIKTRIIELEDLCEAIAAEQDVQLDCESRPEDIAYIVYTSGSTGVPKGVAVTHRGLSNHCQAIAAHYGLSHSDRVLQFASIAFDVAAEEIFPAWASGAAVVLSRRGQPDTIAEFLHFVRHHRLTVLNLPAAYWQEWVREIELPRMNVPSCVRLVITGNEAVAAASLRAWRKHAKGVRWLNAYGPTEATITATVYEPDADLVSLYGDAVPIGRPIANVQAYVLDPELRALPVGASGELFLAGSGIASGYLNRPELTAERFLQNPFDVQPGARMYRTGDRARWRFDGNLEFLGRVDEQIKIRGFRVEPGEIESALREHAGVHEALVVARRELGNDNSQLVAYVIPSERSPIELWPSVGEYPVYDELLYFAMTSDEHRNRAYRAAVERVVPNRTVVEIGTGADAILARLCIEAGAKRVYAIEKSEQATQAARKRIAELDLSDRVTVIYGDSTQIELPELADVCVSEIIGTIGSSEGAVTILNNARRFLKPGGTVVPSRCVTHVAAVTLPGNAWSGAGFSSTSAGYLERIFQSVGHRFDVRLCLKNVDATTLISDTAIFENLDFVTPLPNDSSTNITLTMHRPGILTGLLLWIDLETAPGEHVDSLRQHTSWLPVYFPLFEEGVTVTAGDVLRAVRTSVVSNNGINPDYRLQGALERTGRDTIDFSHQSLYIGSAGNHTPFYRKWLAQPLPMLDETPALTAHELRVRLEQRMPPYMVPAHFVFLKELPRTASHKIDRAALPPPEARAPAQPARKPQGESETILAAIWSAVLNVPTVSLDDNFFHLGGDSILALKIVSRARQANLHLTLEQIFRLPVLSDLAATATAVHPVALSCDAVEGPVPLTPIQHWFFGQELAEAHHYNQAILLEVSTELDGSLVTAALQYVSGHHDALRIRFTRDASGWLQAVRPNDPPMRIDSVSLAGLDEQQCQEITAKETVQRQTTMNQQDGPLAQAVFFEHGPQRPSQLLIVLHHLVVDGVSWRILLEDLEACCGQFAARLPMELPPASSSFASWSKRLANEANSTATIAELGYWLNRTSGPVHPLPRDVDHGMNLEASSDVVTVALPAAETDALLKDAHHAYNTRMPDLLLAALAQVMTRWTGSPVILVDVEGHGREPLFPDVDLSRTVGWFTSVFPVLLEVPTHSRGDDQGAALRAVKEQLAAVPRRGIGYGLLRYLSADADIKKKLAEAPQAEISFNYFGQVDASLNGAALLRPSALIIEGQRSPQQVRSHLLEVNAMVRQGSLQIAWTFSRCRHNRSTIQSLADQYIACLGAAVAHCLSVARSNYTPSDFPLAGVDQKQLDRLFGSIRQNPRRAKT